MRKIAIFVDVQNIYYTTSQAFGRSFNYRELWKTLAARAEISYAFAYTTYRAGHEGQRKFQNALRYIGFEVKLKPFIQRADGSAKGDWDVGITLDVMELAPQVDEVVLLSGDGDFDLLVQRIKELYGVQVTVYGVEQLTANSLIDQACHYIPIDESYLV